MERVFGLIGYPLSHSFSKKYFSAKFADEKIEDCRYELFELPAITDFPDLLQREPNLKGLNVTIPYKQQVIPYLDDLHETADKIGAVNVVRVSENKRLTGYNSDYFGFRASLEPWLEESAILALVLGTGGASKAVMVALDDMRIPYQTVSRKEGKGDLTYDTVAQDPRIIGSYKLIINTTPAGMSPDTERAPQLDYSLITPAHYLYDLIYNPLETRFMKLGAAAGAKVKNGLDMLHLQAEKSWEIWNS